MKGLPLAALHLSGIGGFIVRGCVHYRDWCSCKCPPALCGKQPNCHVGRSCSPCSKRTLNTYSFLYAFRVNQQEVMKKIKNRHHLLINLSIPLKRSAIKFQHRYCYWQPETILFLFLFETVEGVKNVLK